MTSRFKEESGIVYTLSKAEADKLSMKLNEMGMRTLPYHSQTPDSQKRKVRGGKELRRSPSPRS